MGLPFKITTTDPSLTDLLNAHERSVRLNLNCHAIAQIQSFDSSKQTAQVQICYTKTVAIQNADGTISQQQVEYPPIYDVPVISLCGGKSGLTFPIAAGDMCILLFNDRDIDNWTAGATNGPVASGRLHDQSDALALVGLNKVSTFDTSHAMLYNGTTQVGVSSSKVLITNSAGKSLNAVLKDLTKTLTDLNTALTSAFATNAVNGSPLYPGWAAQSATITTDINTAITDIGALLE